MQGQRNPVPCAFRNSSHYSKWRWRVGLTGSPKNYGGLEWNGCSLPLTLYTQALLLSKTPPTVLS